MLKNIFMQDFLSLIIEHRCYISHVLYGAQLIKWNKQRKIAGFNTVLAVASSYKDRKWAQPYAAVKKNALEN